MAHSILRKFDLFDGSKFGYNSISCRLDKNILNKLKNIKNELTKNFRPFGLVWYKGKNNNYWNKGIFFPIKYFLTINDTLNIILKIRELNDSKVYYEEKKNQSLLVRNSIEWAYKNKNILYEGLKYTTAKNPQSYWVKE